MLPNRNSAPPACAKAPLIPRVRGAGTSRRADVIMIDCGAGANSSRACRSRAGSTQGRPPLDNMSGRRGNIARQTSCDERQVDCAGGLAAVGCIVPHRRDGHARNVSRGETDGRTGGGSRLKAASSRIGKQDWQPHGVLGLSVPVEGFWNVLRGFLHIGHNEFLRREMSNVMPELPYLFVYGTLRGAADTEWSRFLIAASRLVGSGRTHGALFNLGGYPGLTISMDDDAWVRGEVYLLDDASSTLPLLDSYEGCSSDDPPPHEFERQIVTARLDSGRDVQAWAYIYSRDTHGKIRIVSGDYLQPECA